MEHASGGETRHGTAQSWRAGLVTFLAIFAFTMASVAGAQNDTPTSEHEAHHASTPAPAGTPAATEAAGSAGMGMGAGTPAPGSMMEAEPFDLMTVLREPSCVGSDVDHRNCGARLKSRNEFKQKCRRRLTAIGKCVIAVLIDAKCAVCCNAAKLQNLRFVTRGKCRP